MQKRGYCSSHTVDQSEELMITMLTDFLTDYLPMCPPFVALVCIYLLANLALYGWTRERGFLIGGATGGLFLIPYLTH